MLLTASTLAWLQGSLAIFPLLDLGVGKTMRADAKAGRLAGSLLARQSFAKGGKLRSKLEKTPSRPAREIGCSGAAAAARNALQVQAAGVKLTNA